MSELLFECYNVPQVAYGIDSLFSFYGYNTKLKGSFSIFIFSFVLFYLSYYNLFIIKKIYYAVNGETIYICGNTIRSIVIYKEFVKSLIIFLLDELMHLH